MNTLYIYLLAWLGMVVIAIINGAIRDKVYGPSMSELRAHQLSTLIGTSLFGFYIYAVTVFSPLASSSEALLIGGIWLLMTISFEFIFGHYVAGHSWKRLFDDYNIFEGRVWIVVLIWVFIAPYVFYQISH